MLEHYDHCYDLFERNSHCQQYPSPTKEQRLPIIYNLNLFRLAFVNEYSLMKTNE